MNKTRLKFNTAPSALAFFAASFVLGVGGVAFVPEARADQALVVGINDYPKLPVGRQLKGAVNDSNAMQDALRQNGFNVTLLQNKAASKTNIVAAFKAIAEKIAPGERFVFYFAGHGNNAPRSLVPSDATPEAENILTDIELKTLVANVPGASRVVILDACFSGGMISKTMELSRPNQRSRFAGIGKRDGSKAGDVFDNVDVFAADPAPAAPVPVKAASTVPPPAPPKTATNIVYVAAALESEKSLEDDYEGTPHGTFTYYLLPHTKADVISHESLGQALNSVKGKVAQDTLDLQNPRFSPGFEKTPLFGASTSFKSESLPDGQKATTVWDIYTQDAPNVKTVRLTVSPSETTVIQNSRGAIQGTAMREGYLVLLDRDQQNRLTVLYPKNADAGRIKFETDDDRKNGVGFRFPFRFKDLGCERLKLILFYNKEEAEAVLAAFAPAGAAGFDFGGAKAVELEGGGVINYVTSQVVYQVVPASETSRTTVQPSETKP